MPCEVLGTGTPSLGESDWLSCNQIATEDLTYIHML